MNIEVGKGKRGPGGDKPRYSLWQAKQTNQIDAKACIHVVSYVTCLTTYYFHGKKNGKETLKFRS